MNVAPNNYVSIHIHASHKNPMIIAKNKFTKQPKVILLRTPPVVIHERQLGTVLGTCLQWPASAAAADLVLEEACRTHQ